MANSIQNLIKIPFRLAEVVSRPVSDMIEKVLGEDVDRFVEALPFGKKIQESSKSVRNWIETDDPDDGKFIDFGSKSE